MKYNFILSVFFCGALNLCGAQDLVSLNVGTTLPDFTFNSSTNVLTVQMTVRNTGFFNSDPFDVAIFLRNTATNTDYEIDRNTYSGLPFTQAGQANTLYITGWDMDLDNESQLPSGNYRVQARINDNQNAEESNYNNNTEFFGNESFAFSSNTVSVTEVDFLNSIYIAPNPTTGKFRVVSGNVNAAQSLNSLKIYDLVGKCIYSKENFLADGSTEVDMTAYRRGLYLVRIEIGESVLTEKVALR